MRVRGLAQAPSRICRSSYSFTKAARLNPAFEPRAGETMRSLTEGCVKRVSSLAFCASGRTLPSAFSNASVPGSCGGATASVGEFSSGIVCIGSAVAAEPNIRRTRSPISCMAWA